jgi:hypothetical protein
MSGLKGFVIAAAGVTLLLCGTAGAQVAVGTATGLPNASAEEIQLLFAQTDDDSIGAAQSFADGWAGFRPVIANHEPGSADLQSPTIGILNSGRSFTNGVTFPIGPRTGPAVPFDGRFELNDIDAGTSGPDRPSARTSGVAVTTGFDAARTVSPSSVPAGDTTVSVTATITLTDARYAGGYVELWVSTGTLPAGGGTATIDYANAVLPATGEGEARQGGSQSATYLDWHVENAKVGKAYTLTVPVLVHNVAGGSAAYRPLVGAKGAFSSDQGSPGDGPSAQFFDPLLDGTITYRVGGDVHWSQTLTTVTSGLLAPVWTPPAAAASGNAANNRIWAYTTGANSVDGATPAAGKLGWQPQISHRSGSAIAGASITVGAGSGLTNAPGFPYTESTASLAPGNSLTMRRLSASQPTDAYRPFERPTGYDVQRTVAPAAVPAGGGDVMATASITLREARFAGGTVQIQVVPQFTVPGAAVTSASLSGPGGGEGVDVNAAQGGGWFVSLHNARTGVAYTLTATIHVPNAAAVAIPFSPQVQVHGITPGTPVPQVVGKSVTIDDTLLGGTITFASTDDVRWSGQTSDVVRTNLFGVWTPPGTGTLAGTVSDGASPVSGALVQACRGACTNATTAADGRYSFLDLPAGGYSITVSPPAGFETATTSATVQGGLTTTRDIVLTAVAPPPPGTTVESLRTAADGVPVVSNSAPIPLSTHGCPGGTATYSIATPAGTVLRSGLALTETPAGSGTYTATVDPLHASSSPLRFSIAFDCGTPTLTFDVYIDPSGHVRTASGLALAGSTVTLSRAASAAGPFAVVPDGSAVMSPQNRRNPDTTDATGHFGWDVLAGFYKVKAAHAGCGTAETDALRVPPPVLDVELKLDCDLPTSVSALAASVAAAAGRQLPAAVVRQLAAAVAGVRPGDPRACRAVTTFASLVAVAVKAGAVDAATAAPWTAEAAHLRTLLAC